MKIFCLAYLLALNAPQFVLVTEFGSPASHHHNHKFDRVFVTAKLEQQGVHIHCRETGHDFIAKFPRALKYCRITGLDDTKSKYQTVYTGDGIDTKGVICDFWLTVVHRGKTGKLSRSGTKVSFLDKLANDSRSKDSEWRIEGGVIGYGVNDDLQTVIVMTTGRILFMSGPIHHMKSGTLPSPVPKSVIVTAKAKSFEICDHLTPSRPICVLDEFFRPTFLKY